MDNSDLEQLSTHELISRLNRACRMVVEERDHALNIARVWERSDREIATLRRRVSELEARLATATFDRKGDYR